MVADVRQTGAMPVDQPVLEKEEFPGSIDWLKPSLIGAAGLASWQWQPGER